MVSAPTTRRNFVASATESVSFAVANQLTAVAVVLPFICVAFGGSAFAAALIFPTYTAANLLGVVLAPRVLGLRSVSRSLALILICGIGIAGFAVMQTTIVFLAAPAPVRSRVMGLLTVAIGAGPIGMLYVGVLADLLGAPAAVALLAIQGLVALGLAAWYWPEMRRPVDLRAHDSQSSPRARPGDGALS